MKILASPGVYLNCFYYDIESCHYNVLKSLGYDVSRFESLDKQERLIQMGLLEREDPQLSKLVRNKVHESISYYLNKNGVKEHDIIVTSYDGFLIRKTMTYLQDLYPIVMSMRHRFKYVVIPEKKKMYLGIEENSFSLKGLRLNPELEKVFREFVRIDFSLPASLTVEILSKIKEKILTSDDKNLFFLPSGHWNKNKEGSGEERVRVTLKKFGIVHLEKNLALETIDCNDIDKGWYFSNVVKPFCDMIFKFISTNL